MPLFMCTKCGCVENTALSDYWTQQCSQCLAGHWHHEFPRKLAEGYLRDKRGFIYTQEQASGSASHMGPFEPVKLPEGARV